jgi:glycosyltransferase involved in cell wall biosynthesis
VRVLTFYIDFDAYRDRILMLRAAAPEVGHIEVLLGSADAAEAAALSTPHLTLTPLSATPLSRTAREAALWRAVLPRVEAGVDLVHDTATYLLSVFARLKLARKRPRLLTSSFTAGYEWHTELRKQYPYPAALYQRVRWMGYMQERAICKLSDAVTVFGEGHVEPMAKAHGIPIGRVHSLPNCCDPEAFGPREPDFAATGFPPGSRILVNVGNQFIYKGTWELLRAFAAVARKHDDARLLLVGRPHEEEEVALRREPDLLGVGDKVRFLGKCPRETLPVLLSTSDVFVFPSYTEGSPRAMLEAMACGLPVIATELAGTRTLDPAGAFTRFVPRADTGELARALGAYLSTPESDLARRREAARSRFLTYHTPEAAAEPLVALYRDLCRG